ncbi:SLC13 family permease [Phaeovibrio sulfidiphilus]|nr:SLC13 family permease [Phaeovibrio sulfidiphilus]
MELIWVLSLLGATIIMFALNKPRMDAVALIMMTVLPFTGIISINEALAGFSDPSVILIAAMFVVGEGLVRTGVAQRMGDLLARRAGGSETRLTVLLMSIVGGVGAFMSSTGVVAIFIPVVLRIAGNLGLAVGRLMMPLSVAALISGMMTLVATPPNLVVNSELHRRGFEGFSFFDFTPFGVPILIMAILYMLFARRWLVSRDERTRARASRPRFATWAKEYDLLGREYRLAVSSSSLFAGRKISMLDLRSRSGVNIISIERKKRFTTEIIKPHPETEIQAGDVLFMDVGTKDFDIDDFCRRHGLRRMPLTGTIFTDQSKLIGMAELMIPADSDLVGKTVVDAAFRSTWGLIVLGIKRGKKPMERMVATEKLNIGDTLLVVGPWSAIRKISQGDRQELIVLNMPAEMDDLVPAPSRAPYALVVLGLVVAMMVTGVVPNVHAALIGCLLLGLFRCVDMASAYRSIHWQSLVLIVGMLPFSLALQKTGGIDLAANAMRTAVGDAGPQVMVAALFVVTAVFGLFISNTATAVLMAPIAIAVATEMGVSPLPYCMAVALAASAAFMTPVSSPVNTLVAGPGQYTFMDFVKIGVPFTVAVMVLTVFLVPVVFPFQP